MVKPCGAGLGIDVGALASQALARHRRGTILVSELGSNSATRSRMIWCVQILNVQARLQQRQLLLECCRARAPCGNTVVGNARMARAQRCWLRSTFTPHSAPCLYIRNRWPRTLNPYEYSYEQSKNTNQVGILGQHLRGSQATTTRRSRQIHPLHPRRNPYQPTPAIYQA